MPCNGCNIFSVSVLRLMTNNCSLLIGTAKPAVLQVLQLGMNNYRAASITARGIGHQRLVLTKGFELRHDSLRELRFAVGGSKICFVMV